MRHFFTVTAVTFLAFRAAPLADEKVARALIADISRSVWTHATGDSVSAAVRGGR